MADAQRFSKLFDDDGQTFMTKDGQSISDVAERMGADREREHEKCRYTFPDGSIITVAGDGWDLGYPDCWCWQGAGHHEDCEDAPADEGYQVRGANVDLVKEFFNCRHAEIDKLGDIWIEFPQLGHWISAEKRAEFEAWLETR